MIQYTDENRKSYFDMALATLAIDMDENGTFAPVRGEHGDTYRVDIDESGDIPTPTKCQCDDFYYRHNHKGYDGCKHIQIVRAFFARIVGVYNQCHEACPTEQPQAQPETEQEVTDPEVVTALAFVQQHLNATNRQLHNASLDAAYAERAPDMVSHCFGCGCLCKGDLCGYCAA